MLIESDCTKEALKQLAARSIPHLLHAGALFEALAYRILRGDALVLPTKNKNLCMRSAGFFGS